MLNEDMKQVILQQWKDQWNNPPVPKSKSNHEKFPHALEIAFIPKMNDEQFEQLKQDIQEAVAQNTLAEFGKILLRKNQGTGRWEVWSGRSRYRALIELGVNVQPFLKFVGGSKEELLKMVIEENVKHRHFESEELGNLLSQATATMAKWKSNKVNAK